MKECTPGNGYQRRSWARGPVCRARWDGGQVCGEKGLEGTVTSGPEGQCWRR